MMEFNTPEHSVSSNSQYDEEHEHDSGNTHDDSPIAPRFKKETCRGVKRHLDFGRYRSEAARKKTARPAGMSDEQLQNIDGYLFHQVKYTIASRFHCLSKNDLSDCMMEFLPRKARDQLPTHCTRQMVNHVANVLSDDYYKYYKNIINKVRHDIRTAMEQIEHFFFDHPKGRGKNVRGRDRWEWYKDTHPDAQMLEQVINGGTSKGFRTRLMDKYHGYLAVHENIEQNISADELKACARHPFFYIASIVCRDKTDMCNCELDGLERNLRSSLEALVIHVWYCDLWDVSSDDPVAWSAQTFKNLVAFVERDRLAVSSEINQPVFKRIIQRLRPFIPCLPPVTEDNTPADFRDTSEDSESDIVSALTRSNRWV